MAQNLKRKLGALCEKFIIETVLVFDKFSFDRPWETLFLLWMEGCYTVEDERAYEAWRASNDAFWAAHKVDDGPSSADPVRLDALAKQYDTWLKTARPRLGRTLHDVGEALFCGHYFQPEGLPSRVDFRDALANDGITMIESVADVPEEVWTDLEPGGSHLSTLFRWRNSGVPESGPITFEMIEKNDLLLHWTENLANILCSACEELWNSMRTEHLQRMANCLRMYQCDHSGEHLNAAFREIDPNFEVAPTPVDLIAKAKKDAAFAQLESFIQGAALHFQPREDGAIPEGVHMSVRVVAPFFVELVRDWEFYTLSVVADWWEREGRAASVGTLTDLKKSGRPGETEDPPGEVGPDRIGSTGYFSAPDLMTKHRIPPNCKSAFEKALQRWREKTLAGYVEDKNRPRHKPQFRYQEAAVKSILERFAPKKDGPGEDAG